MGKAANRIAGGLRHQGVITETSWGGDMVAQDDLSALNRIAPNLTMGYHPRKQWARGRWGE